MMLFIHVSRGNDSASSYDFILFIKPNLKSNKWVGPGVFSTLKSCAETKTAMNSFSTRTVLFFFLETINRNK